MNDELRIAIHYSSFIIHHFSFPSLPSKHLCRPQVVQVDHAFEFPFAVHHWKRSNLARFHQVQGASREFLAADGDRVPRHAVRRRQAERPVPFPLEEAPQVSVRNNPYQTIAVFDYSRMTETLPAH